MTDLFHFLTRGKGCLQSGLGDWDNMKLQMQHCTFSPMSPIQQTLQKYRVGMVVIVENGLD